MKLATQRLLLALLVAVWSMQVSALWLSDTRNHMGTEVKLEFWAHSAEQGELLLETVHKEFARLDVMMNPWNPDSELARINRQAASTAVATTPEIIAVVQRALHYSALSDGAFDISFASVGQHYDYRAGKSPSEEQVRQNITKISYRAIAIDPTQREIRFLQPGLQVDLGGIAKGYAVDRAIEILIKAGVNSAVISAGGDSRILGDLGSRSRIIGIRHPRKSDGYVAMIPLQDTAISTSGDYERFFIRDGVRFHHILNPNTGHSVEGVQSASVMAPTAIDSDALSTSVFVLGVQRGLALINTLTGIDAIIIDGNGKLHYSAELLLSSEP